MSGFPNLAGEVRPLVRGLIWLGSVAVLLAAAPSLGRALDDHGVPGGFVVVALVGAFAIASGLVVLRSRPAARRSAAIRRAADGAAHTTYRAHIDVPSSMRGLPSFSVTTSAADLYDVLELTRPSGDALVFDLVTLPDPGVGEPLRRTGAARRAAGGLLPLIVEPRPWTPDDPTDAFQVMSTDLASFDTRWRVRATDRAFANAFLDQRMIEWIVGLAPRSILEVTDGWAMVSSVHLLPPEERASLVPILDQLVAQIPRVVASLYPASGVGDGPGDVTGAPPNAT